MEKDRSRRNLALSRQEFSTEMRGGNENTIFVSRNDLVDTDSGLTTKQGRQNIDKQRRNLQISNVRSFNSFEACSSQQNFQNLNTANNALIRDKITHNNTSNICGGDRANKKKDVGIFLPYDSRKAPANFRQPLPESTSQYAYQQSVMYQFIPPSGFSQQQQQQHYQPHYFYANQGSYHIYNAATAVAPSGETIYIPLDDSRYEVKRNNSDRYSELHSKPAGSDELYAENSPRPIGVKGSLSDESCESYDRESESETDLDSDDSEIAKRCVKDALNSISASLENLEMKTFADSTEDVNTYSEVSRNCDFETAQQCVSIQNFLKEKLNVGSSESFEKANDKSAPVERKDEVFGSCIANDDGTAETTKFDDREKSSSLEVSNDRSTSGAYQLQEENCTSDETSGKASSDENLNTQLIEIAESIHNSNIVAAEPIQTENVPYDATDINSAQHSPLESTADAINTAIYGQDQTVFIDGQGYLQTYVDQSGQYCYIPDGYTFAQTDYQRDQTSSAPSYTMFIHDAFPPPDPDALYTQPHKSLSGEVMNMTDAPSYMQQASGETPESQQLQNEDCACADSNVNEQTQTGYNIGYMYQTNQQECGSDMDPLSGWMSCSPFGQSPNCFQEITKDAADEKVPTPNEGQIFICYDEDRVYVDPRNGLAYPALHMTDDYLITIILREGIFLEVSADRALRLVNHEKKLVVAINGSGDKACVIHPAARIYQAETSVHTDLYLGRRAKLTDELTMFGNNFKTYKFDQRMVTEMTDEPNFRDMSHDDSVNFLFPDIPDDKVREIMAEALSHAYFWKQGTSGCTVIIHGAKVNQNDKGEVSVYAGPINFLRMNAEMNILRLKSRWVEIDIETNWNVKITRGSHALNASHMGLIVSNGRIKGTLDTNNHMQSFSIPDHRVLMLGQPVSDHRPAVPRTQRRSYRSRRLELEVDHKGYLRRYSPSQEEKSPDSGHYGDSIGKNRENRKRIDYESRRWDPMAGRWVRTAPPWPYRSQH